MGQAPVVAGILGGSGNHVVQIVIGVVVGVVLIAYALSRLLGRGGAGTGRDAVAVGQADRTMARGDGATNEATVRLIRLWTGIIGARTEQWNIVIDGVVVGSIANDETVEVAVEPGHHTLRLGSGRHLSLERSLDVAPDEVAAFSCHGPRFWPMLVAAVVKPDLWITLRRA